MKNTTWKWAAASALAVVAIYLGTLIASAQNATKTDPSEKLDQIIQKTDALAQKVDALAQKVDALSEKVDAVQKDVTFIKARGKG